MAGLNLQCLTKALHGLPIGARAAATVDAMSRLGLLLIVALRCASAAQAAEFAVSPIRLDFEPGVRSAVVSVVNEGAQPLRMQLGLMHWTQDGDGLDRYDESDELIYFPKLMTVPPKERRLVRIGLKAPLGAEERSYRLFLDELAQPGRAGGGSGLSFSIRFALPVFLPPAKPAPQARIDSIVLDGGTLRVGVANGGNQHLRVVSVAARAGDAFARELSGWYLLPGASRIHAIDIPAEVCRGLRRLEITVKTDKLSLDGGLDVEPRMCSR